MSENTKANKKKIISRTIIVVLLIAVIFVGLWLFGVLPNSHGIPNGSYNHLDKNGDYTMDSPEHHISVMLNKAEYRYAKYDIVKKDDALYLTLGETYEYKVEYDDKTKILTVYMPIDTLLVQTGSATGEIVPFYFKRR